MNIFVLYLILRSCDEALDQINTIASLKRKTTTLMAMTLRIIAMMLKSNGLYGGLLLIQTYWINLQPVEGEYYGTRVTAGKRQCHDSFKK